MTACPSSRGGCVLLPRGLGGQNGSEPHAESPKLSALRAGSLLPPSTLAPCFPIPSQLRSLFQQGLPSGEKTGLVVTCCRRVLPRGRSSGDPGTLYPPSAALATPELLSLLWIPLELLPGPEGLAVPWSSQAQVFQCPAPGQQRSGAWLGNGSGIGGAGICPCRAPVTLGCPFPPSIPTMLSVHSEQLNKTGFPTVHAVVLLEGTMNLTGETQPLVEQLMMVKRMQVQK